MEKWEDIKTKIDMVGWCMEYYLLGFSHQVHLLKPESSHIVPEIWDLYDPKGGSFRRIQEQICLVLNFWF